MSILTKEERGGGAMSILTKGERDKWRETKAHTYRAFSPNEMARALDTIDALERIIKDIERATSMEQVETCLIAARALGVIEEDGE